GNHPDVEKMPRWSAEGCSAQRPGRIGRLASVLTRAATGTQRMGAATRTRKAPFRRSTPSHARGTEKEAPPGAPQGRKRPTGPAERWLSVIVNQESRAAGERIAARRRPFSIMP